MVMTVQQELVVAEHQHGDKLVVVKQHELVVATQQEELGVVVEKEEWQSNRSQWQPKSPST